jgi:hypothetical protein
MANLKNQQKKLLTREITGGIMQCFMGLNEKNESLRQIAEKSSMKLVNAYFDAIKSQHKKALKSIRNEENRQSTVAAPVVYAQQTHSITS